MAGRTKKKSRKVKNGGTDRLSSLDDSLLLRILSPVDTLEAIRTCVLSKRWRHLWKSIPALIVDEKYMYPAKYFSQTRSSFSDLVKQFLLRRDDCEVHEVRLVARKIWDCFIITTEAVVQYAVNHGVQEINLDFDDLHGFGCPYDFELPPCFSHCQSLRKLELSFRDPKYTSLPKKMGLTALTSLSLDNVSFSQDNFDGSLFTRSPNLQTLELLNIGCEGLVTFDIHAPSLRTLKFDFRYGDPDLDGCKVVIIAPKLTTFTFSGPTPMACSVDTASLQHVSIDFSDPEGVCCGEDEEEVEEDSYLVLRSIKMVNEFRAAKCMTMTPETIKFISPLPTLLDGHLSKFENLNHLTIKTRNAQDFVLPLFILKYFLNSTTTLEFCKRSFEYRC